MIVPLQVLGDCGALESERLHCSHSAVHDGEWGECRGVSPETEFLLSPGRLNALSGMASFSQVSVKHRAAKFEKSLFIRESRRRSSVLLGREWRFARWMLGSGVLNPRCLRFTSAPARFPRLRRSSTNYNVFVKSVIQIKVT